MATVVFQSEKQGSVRVYHIAVMNDGAVGEHTYPRWREHAELAHYLCCGTPLTEYLTWDNLSERAIETIMEDEVGKMICPKCLGMIEGT